MEDSGWQSLNGVACPSMQRDRRHEEHLKSLPQAINRGGIVPAYSKWALKAVDGQHALLICTSL
eukprot:1158651-Pelagomonas_calceolata.AAC.4